jgi:nucleotide-binding universal stress UspA family protein
MRFFENILLFYNDEFAGIKAKVLRLVRKNQARLTIIDVFDNFDQYLELLPPSSSIDELKEVIISERRLEILGNFEADPGINSQINVIFKFGNPVVEIIKEAIRGEHDLVIKAASGNKTFKDYLFGNIAVKLLRKCPCPVLIIKPSEGVSFQKILAPVDPETERQKTTKPGEHEDLICRKVMDISIFMARMETSHLDIFHCWFLPGETLLASGRTRIAPDKLNRMKMLAEKIHTQRISTLAEEYDLSDIHHSVVVRKGDPSHMIVDYADKNGVDLIVMGTIGRSGLSGLLIGSTAEKVIDQVNCSVLTIKPTNFKSPITIR